MLWVRNSHWRPAARTHKSQLLQDPTIRQQCGWERAGYGDGFYMQASRLEERLNAQYHTDSKINCQIQHPRWSSCNQITTMPSPERLKEVQQGSTKNPVKRWMHLKEHWKVPFRYSRTQFKLVFLNHVCQCLAHLKCQNQAISWLAAILKCLVLKAELEGSWVSESMSLFLNDSRMKGDTIGARGFENDKLQEHVQNIGI